jgi:N-acetylmuramoyl-L-alanine amidase
MPESDRPRGRCLRAGPVERWRAPVALAVVASLALGGMADVSHVVTVGETLTSIAAHFATTPQAIAKANHLANPNLVVIGAHLQIPGAAPAPARPPAPRPIALRTTVTYTVRSGDSLTTIAARYGVSTTALGAANSIRNPNLVRVGQVLTVPIAPAVDVQALLLKYSQAYKVDAALVQALAWQESGWQQRVVSELGAVGVMQIMPGTGRFTGEVLLQRSVDVANIEHNVEAGVAFLAYLLKQAGGDEKLAVAGYYQGLRSVRKKGMTADTKHYVANVMALRQRFAS